MQLLPGTRLGSYEITGRIGAGAMGEVYRARDTRLNRDVAIKVLPDVFAEDPDRLARFQREAQTLAALNHPNIAQIYGVIDLPPEGVRSRTGPASRRHALVMEFVDGEDLAERLARGPMRSHEALPIVRQIADGLDAAHEQGIVHRDLKPANIKLRPDGSVKILDFGLAKATGAAAAANTATITGAATLPGVVMGTPAYMSPEQARGRPQDARTDIWALGCVAFEMLTGRRPFAGETTSDVIVSILEREPDWNAATLSAFERRLLGRCLAKDPRRRFHDAGDISLTIEDGMAEGTHTQREAVVAPGSRAKRLLAIAAVALAAAIAGVAMDRLLARRVSRSDPVISRIAVPLSGDDRLELQRCPTFALSPDGTELAFIAVRDGRRQLFVRHLNELEPRIVRGGEDAVDTILFSPDGKWIAFFANGQLRKVPVTGGAPVAVATTPACGGDWPAADRILWGSREGVFEVSPGGGQPRRLIATDRASGELAMYSPQALPDGHTLMFTLSGRTDTRVVAQRPGSTERVVLIERGHDATYADGRLFYGDGGAIFSVPFDAPTLKVTGVPSPVLDGAAQLEGGVTHVSIARSGAIAYAPGGVLERTKQTAVWFDRRGNPQAIPIPAGRYSWARLSPDGRRLALTKSDGGRNDVWIYDFDRTTLAPLTTDSDNRMPIWMPDGQRVIYASDRAGGLPDLYARRADGAGGEERLTTGERMEFPGAVSPDGRWLAFLQYDSMVHSAIWLLPLEGDRKPRPYFASRFNQVDPAISPDGRWMAYVSNDTTREEIYVQPFPDAGARIQISTDGGRFPVWSRDGRQLFYRNGTKVMAVDVVWQPAFRAGRPAVLFDDQGATTALDVSRDGRLFTLTVSRAASPIRRINVLLKPRP